LATIGWIGRGNLGGPMTANRARAGRTVFGFDLDPAARQLISAGEGGLDWSAIVKFVNATPAATA
jgi:3-hydroxyisobutyrate dehydrogenase